MASPVFIPEKDASRLLAEITTFDVLRSAKPTTRSAETSAEVYIAACALIDDVRRILDPVHETKPYQNNVCQKCGALVYGQGVCPSCFSNKLDEPDTPASVSLATMSCECDPRIHPELSELTDISNIICPACGGAVSFDGCEPDEHYGNGFYIRSERFSCKACDCQFDISDRFVLDPASRSIAMDTDSACVSRIVKVYPADASDGASPIDILYIDANNLAEVQKEAKRRIDENEYDVNVRFDILDENA